MMPQDVLPPSTPPPVSQASTEPAVPNFEDNPDAQTKVVDSKDPQKEGWKSILSTAIILIAAPMVALLLINFVFQSYEVDGPSMETTLQNHDRLIVDKIPRTLARIDGKNYIPKRGDVIIFVKKGLVDTYGIGDKQLIKRVIGLPGDRVVVADNHITVYNKDHPNGFNPDTNPLYSAVIKGAPAPSDIDVTLKSDEVFVCGDNRYNSLDSRTFGPVPVSGIIGKLAFRIYPLSKAQSF